MAGIYDRRTSHYSGSEAPRGTHAKINKSWHCRCGAIHRRSDVICPVRYPLVALRNSQPPVEA